MNKASNVTEFKPKTPMAFTPQSLEEAMNFCNLLSTSTLVPKDFQDKPGNILVAVQWGLELGLQPMQAMQNIAVVNGRPSIWGDALIALCISSPLCAYVRETFEGEGDKLVAICRTKRKGDAEETVRMFSVADAKQAGLWGKNTWASYPKRMLQMRARGWALRDAFPDVLRGMAVAEEALDMPPEKNMGMAEVVPTPSSAASNPTADLNAAVQAKKDAAAQQAATPSPAVAESPVAPAANGGEADQPGNENSADTGSELVYTDADAEQAFEKYLTALKLVKTAADFEECEKMFAALPDGPIKVTAKGYRKDRLDELKKAPKASTPPSAAGDMFGDEPPF